MSEVLQIQFRGVNEGDDPKALPPGTLLKAENCAMDKGRRLLKRAGTTSLVKTALSGSNPALGKRLLTTGENTSITDGQTAWEYSEALAKWNPTDRPPSWRVTKRGLVDTTRSVAAVDIAISGSLLVTIYTTVAGGCYVHVSDLTTGQTVLRPLTLASSGATFPRVLITGNNARLLFKSSGTVEYQTLDMTTFALGASGSLVADATTLPSPFDAVVGTPTGGVPVLYLAYQLEAGAVRFTLTSFTESTMAFLAGAVLAVASTGLTCCCIAFGDLAQQVTVAYAHTSANLTRVATFGTALGAGTAGPTTLDAVAATHVFIAEDDATNLLAGWVRLDSTGSPDAWRMTTALYSVAAHAQVATSERITYHLYALTKPWRTSGRWFTSVMTYALSYSVTIGDPLAQPSTVVVEVETADSLTGVQDATHPHVATLQNYTGWFAAPPTTGGGAAQTKSATDADGKVWLASPYRDREPKNRSDAIPIGWDIFTMEAQGGDTFSTAPLGGSALGAGGAPFWLESASAMPYGYAIAPQIIKVTDTGAGALAAGTYSYVVTYAWRDSNGVLHRSAPSPPKIGTAGANRALTLEVSTSSLSAKLRTLTGTGVASPILLEVWRTDGIAATGPHYRLTYEPTDQLLINDPRAKAVSLVDTKAPASIAGASPAITLASQAQLYTDLGELENIPPPAFTTDTTHRGRLVGIGPDERTVWLSKDSTLDPTLAPGFNEALTLAFTTRKTALASLDEKLVVFGETNIDVVHGDGPDDSGNQNTWQIQRVQSDTGCVNPRCVAVGPMGVVFESERGIEMLGRDLTLSWIGQGIDDTLALFPVITSATLVAVESEIRFTCNAEDGATGIVLAWSYIYGIWFVRKYKDAADTLAASIPFVDAALINGVYTLLTAGGQVYRETSAHKLDNGTDYVAMDVVLAPISPTGAMTWQRIKDCTVLGTSVSNHDLSVSAASDYATSYEQTETFAAGTVPTTIGPRELCRVTLAKQKCQAMQIRIQDVSPSNPATYPIGTGDGPIIEALALRVSAKRGQVPKTSAEAQK